MISVIIGTNNFGLGPVGKVSSIVNSLKNEFNWYACGNEFDLNIFENDTFKGTVFTKDKEKIRKLVQNNNIKYAIVVLDVELSNILLELGVKVIFVDSLPFMWTQADIDEGLLPLDATVYCAQKCVNLTDHSKKVLSQIKNLRWIDPIQNKSDNKYKPFAESYVIMNVGGLHSPIGNGESYIKTVILPIAKVLKDNNKKCVITCGSNAKKTIDKIILLDKEKYDNIITITMKQTNFLSAVYNSDLFLTSPGLTTIYETSSINKPTILLPPQNLSQFYNIEYAKKILNKYKELTWETEKLNLEYLNGILEYGETYVVNKIYEYITELVDYDYSKTIEKRFSTLLQEEYNDKIESDFKIEGNGVDEISNILQELIKEYKNEE